MAEPSAERNPSRPCRRHRRTHSATFLRPQFQCQISGQPRFRRVEVVLGLISEVQAALVLPA